MPSYTQKGRVLSFTSPLGADKLLALKFQGTEAISELFSYKADLLTEAPLLVAPSALVGKSVTMSIELNAGGPHRYFNGIISTLEGASGDNLFNRYSVQIVPKMWLLSLSKQTRVFQNKDVLTIVREVFEPYSLTQRVETQKTYPTLEYCTQYRETDLEFVERMLALHGIFYYFTHSESAHTLVLSDSSTLCSPCPVMSNLTFQNNSTGMLDFYKPCVYAFWSQTTLVPGKYTSWDHRFMKDAVSHASPQTESSNAELKNNHEVYDYTDSAAAFFKTEGAEPKTLTMQTHLQVAARDAADAQAVQCEGHSTASTLQAGFTFMLNKYPQSDKNIKYLVTQVEHSAEQWPGYHPEETSDKEAPYRNVFHARPFDQAFLKPRTTPKPRVNGVVTGKVVTHKGTDSHLDKFGRVCVQFWWDRQRPPHTPDNTLLRVAQQWAGKGWGTYFWPRVGDEVLIDFIDGDPDAPIVVGSLYNGVNMPKYDPKTEYTRAGILTRSSEDGGPKNANELRFEDRMGSEEILIHAERDFNLGVEKDRHMSVGRSDHSKVGKEQRIQVGGDRRVTVSGMQMSKTGVNHTIQANSSVLVHGMEFAVLQTEGLLYLMVEGVSLAITAAGLAILAALNVGELVPPPPIVLMSGLPATECLKCDGLEDKV